MNIFWCGFLAGVLIGAFAGVIAVSCCALAGRAAQMAGVKNDES